MMKRLETTGLLRMIASNILSVSFNDKACRRRGYLVGGTGTVEEGSNETKVVSLLFLFDGVLLA
jgi:hypothetical protein